MKLDYTSLTLFKLISLIAFSLTSIALIIIIIWPAAEGYEITIYAAYPFYFWLVLIVSVLISFFLITYSIFSEQKVLSFLGFISLAFNYIILFFLPKLRGYVLMGRGAGDILTHIGWAKDIVNLGHFSNMNFYPVTHVLISFCNFFGLSFEYGARFISVFLFLLYILFLYVLGVSLSKNRKIALFLSLFGSAIIFSEYYFTLHPELLSFYLLPLLLYSAYKVDTCEGEKSFIIVLIILLFLLAFFHPITFIFAIAIISIFIIYRVIFSYKKGMKIDSRYINKKLFFLLIAISPFIVWFIYNQRVTQPVQRIISGNYKTLLQHSFNLFGNVDLTIFETISLLLFKYGPLLLYLIAATIAAFYLLLKYFVKQLDQIEKYGLIQYAVGLGFSGALIVGYFIVFGIYRASKFIALTACIILAISFFIIYREKQSHRKKLLALFISVICIVNILGIMNLYPSQRTISPNTQLAPIENCGNQFFLEKRSRDIPLVANYYNLRKIKDYYYGISQSKEIRGSFLNNEIPSHFGYDRNYTLAEILPYPNQYMITNEVYRQIDQAYPPYLRPYSNQYLREDFDRLHNDPTVDKIYANGGLECWIVQN